jgi:hypothetical protein
LVQARQQEIPLEKAQMVHQQVLILQTQLAAVVVVMMVAAVVTVWGVQVDQAAAETELRQVVLEQRGKVLQDNQERYQALVQAAVVALVVLLQDLQHQPQVMVELDQTLIHHGLVPQVQVTAVITQEAVLEAAQQMQQVELVAVLLLQPQEIKQVD